MLCHYGFLELVHSSRLERLGKDRAACSGETVAAHWLDEPGAEASASESSGAAPKSLVFACGTEDVVHA
jgi:hypothetical protein